MRVSYKRAAVKDMEATRDYIAGQLKNPKAAKKLMTALLKAISLLADNPYMGAALAEKFEIATDVRYFVVSKQLIFYRVDGENDTVEILRVLDGRTDYLSVLFGWRIPACHTACRTLCSCRKGHYPQPDRKSLGGLSFQNRLL